MSQLAQRRRTRRLTRTPFVSPSVVRDWARSAGIEVGLRGRVPQAVFEQYRQALQMGPQAEYNNS